ncbi:MAG: hypothetical protein HY671_01490 [Chloroflexi bacterium]|nr:hypothetical protein [Chloroflexota bacterium]
MKGRPVDRPSTSRRLVFRGIIGKLPRSVFHMFGVAVAPAVSLFVPSKVFLIGMAMVTGLFMAFESARFADRKVNRWFFRYCVRLLRGNEVSRLTGVTYVMVAILICFLVFERDIAIMAMAFLAVGDPLSGLIGPWGRWWWKGKTVEGHLAFLIPSLAAGWALNSYLFGLPPVIPVVGAVVAVALHALPLPVNDNLSIPVASGAAMAAVGMWG